MSVVRDDIEVAWWHLQVPGRCDLATVDQLARWQLHARRNGCSLRVRGASPALVELLDLCGLDDLLRFPGAGDTDPYRRR